ncbi:uncharacterized protein LOC110453378 isoform X2 [Mizuhopecten yessoensis]|uniref:uncharacterized protein LOC110453378 isoform X2 n=1 Tax=Mizuhopecten yessoensis TaxID=6573 RepID=UPI000B45733A|nr:uncharacterized protein LOC110453378 isoform X2 [Mizuhopecten yessoensis]
MTSLTLVAVYLVCLCVGRHAQIVQRTGKVVEPSQYNSIQRQRYGHPSSADSSGHATICGPPNVKASFSWYPKTPSRNQNINFVLNITALVDISSGTLSGDIYLSKVKQKIFQFNYPFTCEKLRRKVKITCPIQMSNQYDIPFLVKAGLLPMGSFEVNGKVQNQDKKVFLCFKLNITVTD